MHAWLMDHSIMQQKSELMEGVVVTGGPHEVRRKEAEIEFGKFYLEEGVRKDL